MGLVDVAHARNPSLDFQMFIIEALLPTSAITKLRYLEPRCIFLYRTCIERFLQAFEFRSTARVVVQEPSFASQMRNTYNTKSQHHTLSFPSHMSPY